MKHKHLNLLEKVDGHKNVKLLKRENKLIYSNLKKKC